MFYSILYEGQLLLIGSTASIEIKVNIQISKVSAF